MTHAFAAATGAPTAAPSEPSFGRIDAGVPNSFQRSCTGPRAATALRCSEDGATDPRTSISRRPWTGSPIVRLTAGVGPGEEGALVALAGSWP